MSTIPAEYLPPKEFQPQRIYKLKEFESYPDPLNSTEELLDKQVAAGRGDKPRGPDRRQGHHVQAAAGGVQQDRQRPEEAGCRGSGPGPAPIAQRSARPLHELRRLEDRGRDRPDLAHALSQRDRLHRQQRGSQGDRRGGGVSGRGRQGATEPEDRQADHRLRRAAGGAQGAGTSLLRSTSSSQRVPCPGSGPPARARRSPSFSTRRERPACRRERPTTWKRP